MSIESFGVCILYLPVRVCRMLGDLRDYMLRGAWTGVGGSSDHRPLLFLISLRSHARPSGT